MSKPKRICDRAAGPIDEEDGCNRIELRDYQRILFEKSLHSNLIVALPTGAGKTMIAINLIRHKLHQTEGPYPKVARRTVFLAPTRVLVNQHYDTLSHWIPGSIAKMHRENRVELFTREMWNVYLAKYQVLLCTPAILKDAITRGLIHFENLNLMVFDEAHWALSQGSKHSKHNYRQLLDDYRQKIDQIPPERRPQILALSASVFSSQIDLTQIQQTVTEMEQIFQARLESYDAVSVNKAHVFVCITDDSQYVHRMKMLHRDDAQANMDCKSVFAQTLSKLDQFPKDFTIAKALKQAVEKVNTLCFEELGPWFAVEALELYKESIATNPSITTLRPYLQHLFSQMRQSIKHQFCEPQWSDVDFALHSAKSDKLRALLGFLQIFRANLNCIVFVKARLDANLIYRWIRLIAASLPKYDFIKPGFICGVSSKDFVRFDRNTANFKQQLESRQLNLMVATAVLEEGIDVPICNVVIRYNFPCTYREFVQSKGRARDVNSYYIMLVDKYREEMDNKRKCLKNYYQIEQYFKGISKSRTQKSFHNERPVLHSHVEQWQSGQLEPPPTISFRTVEGAELTEKESHRILNQYLQLLPADMFTERRTQLVPLPTRGSVAKPLYCYAFVFPINSSLAGQVVQGQYRHQKRDAKHSCTFAACKVLYQSGELDGHFNIMRRESFLSRHLAELNLKVHDHIYIQRKHRAETKAKYERHIAEYCSNLQLPLSLQGAVITYHLYAIDFHDSYHLFGCSSNVHTIGFVATEKLPAAEAAIQSVMYINRDRVKFSIVYIGQTSGSGFLDLSLVKFFHAHVIENLIMLSHGSSKSRTCLNWKPNCTIESNFFLVPILRRPIDEGGFQIDYERMHTLRRWIDKMFSLNERLKRPRNVPQDLAELKQRFPKDTLVALHHKPSPMIMCLSSITTVLPVDTFELKASKRRPLEDCEKVCSYVRYYRDKFGITLQQTSLPLLKLHLAENVFARRWKFATTYVVPKKKRDNVVPATAESSSNSSSLYPPELCSVYPLPMSFVVMANTIPPVLYRLQQYLVACDFLQHKIAASPSSPFEHSPLHDVESLITADSFYNQNGIDFPKLACSTAALSEDHPPVITNDRETPSDYQLIPLKQIEDKLSHFPSQTASSNPGISLLAEALPDIISHITDPGATMFSPETPPLVDYQNGETLEQVLESVQDVMRTMDSFGNDRLSVFTVAESTSLRYGQASMLMFVGDIAQHIDLTFDKFDQVVYPHPWHITKALTTAKAQDVWHLEQLETVGDSYLKFTAAVYMYFAYPAYDEGKLSNLKAALVCNENLAKLAIDCDLPRFINNSPVLLHKNWTVPFYKPPPQQTLSPVVASHQELKIKEIADCVESLIGTFVFHGTAAATVTLFDRLGLKCFNPLMNLDSPLLNPTQYHQCELEKHCAVLDVANRTQFNGGDIGEMALTAYRLGLYHKVEEVIGYTFEHKYFLVQAFTHPSYHESSDRHSCHNNAIASYQRLEFIGDAIVDYLVVHFVYHRNQRLIPQQLTQIRNALVNNTFYASIAVKYGLHMFLRASAPTLFESISRFVKRFKCQTVEQFGAMMAYAVGEQESDVVNEVEVPKAVADIFEALVGAIYLDSRFSLDAVWKVVYRMIKVELDYFIANIPENPLCWLNNHFADRYTFSDWVQMKEGDLKQITLTLKDAIGGELKFVGVGTNVRQCRALAAKRAMAHYYKQKAEDQLEPTGANCNEMIDADNQT